MSEDTYRKRLQASGRVPAATLDRLAEAGLAVYVVAVVLQDIDAKVHTVLGTPCYTPASIMKIADALLALEEQVDQAIATGEVPT